MGDFLGALATEIWQNWPFWRFLTQILRFRKIWRNTPYFWCNHCNLEVSAFSNPVFPPMKVEDSLQSAGFISSFPCSWNQKAFESKCRESYCVNLADSVNLSKSLTKTLKTQWRFRICQPTEVQVPHPLPWVWQKITLEKLKFLILFDHFIQKLKLIYCSILKWFSLKVKNYSKPGTSFGNGLKFDLVPSVTSGEASNSYENSAILKRLLHGSENQIEQQSCQDASEQKGFLISESLTKKIISMETGSEVRISQCGKTKNSLSPRKNISWNQLFSNKL